MAAILVGTVDVGVWYLGSRSGAVLPAFGMDLDTYRTAAATWLQTGEWFAPYQVAGPYTMEAQPILYPPSAIPMFAAFTVLPAFLWWAVPLGIIAMSLPRSGPRLALVLALLAWPQTVSLIWAGNPVMWMAAFLALSRRWPWFAPFVLLKPTLAPFALYGIHRRGWWVGLAVLAVLSLVFLPMWRDYVVVLQNAHDQQGWLYIFANVPLMLVPLVFQDSPKDP